LINRSGKAAGLPAGAEIVAGDAYDVNKNIEWTNGAAAIYQCAQPPYHEWAEKFPRLQSAIMEAAVMNNSKFIVADNLYMYGDTHGQPIREDSPYQPRTKKGKVRAEMADAVMAAHRAGKVRAAIGRASDFFGPYDHGVTDYAIRPAVLGKTINLLGNMDQPHTFSYVADFGKLLAILGTREDAFGQIWFLPSPTPVTQRVWVKIMEEEVGGRIKVLAGNTTMMRLLGLFNPTLRETVEMMYEWTQPFIMDSSKAEKAFGWKGTSLQQATHETIAWLRENMGTQEISLLEQKNGKDIQRSLYRENG
jgi:nucleoside-diphosphate-sugar epimerase